MTIAVVGQKRGMTRLYLDDGAAVPVTVIEVGKNRVTQVKLPGSDGYAAVQLAYGSKRPGLVNKAEAGQYAKAGVAPAQGLFEVRVAETEIADLVPGAEVDVSVFTAGQKVDVRGVSKGKGFAGGVKRWNFRMQDATHGNSLSHRAVGSTGQNQTPGRVFKGKKMPGQMGNRQITQQGLEIVRVDEARGLLLLKGSVPGATGGYVTISTSVKSPAVDFAWCKDNGVSEEQAPSGDVPAAEASADQASEADT